MKSFMFFGFAVIEIRLFNSKKQQNMDVATLKIEITSITPVLRAFLDFFQISLTFNMFPTLMLVEVKLSGN